MTPKASEPETEAMVVSMPVVQAAMVVAMVFIMNQVCSMSNTSKMYISDHSNTLNNPPDRGDQHKRE